MTIDIWNPKELPFGALSNNTVYIMNIEEQTYKTVSNFIYSNLMKNTEYFEVLKNMNTQDIYEYFNKYDKEMFENIIIKSVYEGMKEKFNNEAMEDILISTENYPIIYVNEDNILGIGSRGEGKNIIGKCLSELRTSLKNKVISKEEKMYEAYLALTILDNLMLQEKNDLRTFTGLNQKEIIEKYILLKASEIAKKQNIDLSSMSSEQIIEKYKNSIIKLPPKDILERLKVSFDSPEIDIKYKMFSNLQILQLLESSLTNPRLLILYIKRKYIRDLRISQLNKIKDSIFNIYVDDILETKYPTLAKNDYEKAKQKEFNINVLELNVIKEQIYECYKLKLLNENVLNKIKKSVDTYVIPEKTVETIEGMDILYMVNEFKKGEENIAIEFEAFSTYEETPYFVLSPFAYTGMLKINGLYYPSIMHYVIANLFYNLPEMGDMSKAHNYLLYNIDGDKEDRLNYEDYENLFYKYENEKYQKFINLRKKLATISLNKKFEDIGLQELLLATGNNNLVWKDNNDDILGLGPTGKGENFVGKYLIELRNKFRANEKLIETIPLKDINIIMTNDLFMKSWCEMRLNDICKIIKEVREYIIKKYSIELIQSKEKTLKKPIPIKPEVEINKKFITDVLNKIYFPCNDIIENYENKTTPPDYFLSLVKNCFGFKTVSSEPEIVSLVWDRIISMIYFISQYIPKLKNIKQVLAKIEVMVSSKTACVKIVDNNFENCIISALVNIIKKLNDFSKTMGYTSNVTKIDIETAINIILNRRKEKLDDNVPDFTSFIKENEYTNDIDVLNVGDYNIDINDMTEEQMEEQIRLSSKFNDYDEEDEDEESKEIDYSYDEDDNILDEDSGEHDGAYRKQRKTRKQIDRWAEIQREINLDLERKERIRFEKYKNVNKVTLFLDKNNIISDNNNVLAEYIIDAVNIIKTYKMSNKIKTNRINFFATTV